MSVPALHTESKLTQGVLLPVFAFPGLPQQFLIYPPLPLLSSALPKKKSAFY